MIKEENECIYVHLMQLKDYTVMIRLFFKTKLVEG